LDTETPRQITINNRRRLLRAVEICLTTGKPVSRQRGQWAVAASLCEARRTGVVAGPRDASQSEAATTTHGAFVFRDREELYTRINDRVEAMLDRKSVV